MLIKAGKYAVLSGFVPRDAELRQTQTGKTVANFSVKRGDVVNEDGTRTAQWINCVAWQKVADIAKYIAKGDTVLCAGELQERSYDTRDGDTRTVTELVCEFVQIMQPPGAAPEFPGTVSYSADKPLTGDGDGFEEIVTDDDLPF